MTERALRIIGGGLAGSEAAWQAVSRGIPVIIHEMRPKVMTKAHRTDRLAELVCSNSFRGADLSNAVGLLKEELRVSQSLIMKAADLAQVPAGGALAVDREVFSAHITETLRAHPLVTVSTDEVCQIPSDFSAERPVVIATGPLTSAALAQSIEAFLGHGRLAFFDAISPIIHVDSINMDKVFRQSRYDKGSGSDYLNVPLDQDRYVAFVEAVRTAEKFGGHEEVESDYVDNLRPFEGCMPIEEMVARGPDTLMFGPLKPVGLRDPKTGKRPHAVVQLRQDDKAGTLWSMVGMQTKMKHPEQVRVFRMLPGLEEAEFVRLGSVHRNSFIQSPMCLQPTLEIRNRPGLYFAGQITGVEGYVESTSGGLVAGINAVRRMSGEEPLAFPLATAIGSLMAYISDPERKDFQPMNISFGLMGSYSAALSQRRKGAGKRDVRREVSAHALDVLAGWLKQSAIL